MTEKKKLIFKGGAFVWQMPDGTTRPLSKEEIKRAKTQIGQARSTNTKKQLRKQDI